VGIIYYSLLLPIPLVMGIIGAVSLGEPILRSIRQAYYPLFFGYFIAYAAIMLLLLSLTSFILPFSFNFIMFTFGYVLVFSLKTFLFTEPHDILENLPGVKKSESLK